MKKAMLGLCLGLCLFSVGAGVVMAQDELSPPKVLVIQREFLKPGKSGAVHMKSESAFVQAMVAAKSPTHYLGMDSLSGVSRALFFIGYPSFAAWEKDNADTAKNATLSSALDRASLADGDLLTEYSSSTWLFNEEQSLNTNNIDLGTMRYFEILRFKVKPGHEWDWSQLVKLYKEGYAKAVPGARWATFGNMYGDGDGGMYLVITPMKSMAEVDQEASDAKKFEQAMGESGMKKLSELAAACIADSQSNLFQFNPKESYPRDSWVKADPTFWKPKAAIAAAAKKPEAKPAE